MLLKKHFFTVKMKYNHFRKILLYLKENTFETNSAPKRKKGQNNVKTTVEEKNFCT